MNNSSKNILDVTREGYKNYGSYVNNFRHIPLAFDGLKPSYRRAIYGAIQLCGSSNKFIKTAQLSGHVMGNLHPHGTSIEGVIVQLVQVGILEGQGNFGGATVTGDKFEPAASRYTEVRVDPLWHSIFSELMPYVEWEPSYIGVQMPSYLPTPLPLSLLFGSLGIGFGTGCMIPNFSAKSMIDAYLSNDPYKLSPNYNNITFNYAHCDFENMWDKGYANLAYLPTIRRGATPDCSDGIFIETDNRFIVPNLPWVNQKVAEGRLFTRDESDGSGDRLFIGKYPKIQEGMNYWEEYCITSTEFADTFRLYVTDGNTTRLISLRDWIHFTYTRYLTYIETMKSSRISKIEKDIRVTKLIPMVGQCIHENPMADEWYIKEWIGHNTNINDIKECLSKPIRKLLKSDYGNELESLEKLLNTTKAINSEEYTKNILDKMK